MKKFIVLFFFTLLPVQAVERYDGQVDPSPNSIDLKLNNFNGHFIQIDEGDANSIFKIIIKNNKLKLEVYINEDGTYSIDPTDYGGIRIEVKTNGMKLLKAEMKEGRNEKWKDIRNMKIAGLQLSKIFTSSLDIYYNRKYQLNMGHKYSLKSYMKAMGISDPEILKDFGGSIESVYRGITCFKNRKNYLIEHYYQNNYSGYTLHETSSGLRHGGYFELSILGEKMYEDFNSSYFVGLEKNCDASQASSSTNRSSGSVKGKLKELKSMLDEGLISQEQYDEKSSKILDEF
jgi:hypothetical protein